MYRSTFIKALVVVNAMLVNNFQKKQCLHSRIQTLPRYYSNNLRWMDMRKSIHIDFLYILSIYLVQQIKALLLKIHVHICIPGEFFFSSVVRPLDMHCQPRCLDFRVTKNVVLPILNTPGPWLLRISLTVSKKFLNICHMPILCTISFMRFLVYFDH